MFIPKLTTTPRKLEKEKTESHFIKKILNLFLDKTVSGDGFRQS